MTGLYVPGDKLSDLMNHPRIHPWLGMAPGLAIPKEWVCMRFRDVGAVFHPAPWPGVWYGHHMVHPRHWGREGLKIATGLLDAFALDYRIKRILGWTDSRNVLACRYAGRLGFEEDGRMRVGDTVLVMYGKGYS